MMKTLSVIVPTYNVEDYISKCLSSLIINREDLEVLVIIDGSKDKSCEIAKTYHDRCPGIIKVIEKENGHYGSCVNVGLSLAQGKYVKILDADDFFNEENFSSYLDFAAQSEADLLLSDSGVIKNGESNSFYSFSLPGNVTLNIKQLDNKNLYDLPHQSIAYKREILMKIGYVQTEGYPFTDLEWVSYPMIAVNTLEYFPKVLYEYLLSREGQSVSQAAHCKTMKEDCIIVEKMATYYEKFKDVIPVENRRVLREIVLSNVTRIYFHCLINWPKLIDNDILVDYDDKLKSISSELYEMAGDRIERRKFMSFKFIQEWRKKQSRNTIVYALFDLGVTIGRLVS